MYLASYKLSGYQISGHRAMLRGIQVGLTPGATFQMLLGKQCRHSTPGTSQHPDLACH